jgi:hypothetical protein
MPITEGKQKASRIPLDYYKHPDPLVRWKRLLAWGLAAVTVVWIGSSFLFGSKGILGQHRFSHGAVAVAHKPIENDCAACHADFGLFAGKDSVDKKCQTCHLEPPRDVHHESQKADMTPNCGRCHSDHHGLDFNLVRTTDRDCIVCHKDLPASMDGTPKYAAKISSFSENHPEFSVLGASGKRILLSEAKAHDQDPGKLKFNHKYHMTEGIVLAAGGKGLTVGEILSAEQQTRFSNGRGKKELVQLACANCHETETLPELSKDNWPNPETDRKGWEEAVQKFFAAKQDARGRLSSGELLPPRKTGKYMKPISYDNHCAGCHPLLFDPNVGPVEHGLKLDALETELKRIYEAEYAKSPANLVTRSQSFLPLPGKRLTAEEPSRALIVEKVEQAKRALLPGKRACGECHTDDKGEALTVASTSIASPDVPVIWLKHARFDHAAHDTKGIDCRVCHQEAYPSTEKDLLAAYHLPRKGAEKVMIEGIDNCKQCHSSSPKEEFADRGWQARQDCTECHSYHQGKPGKSGH